MSEQLRLKSRTEVPNGGWRFFQAETLWKAPFTLSDTFDVAVRKIIYHRKGNARFNLPTEYETVALELEDQTARSLISRGMGGQYVQGAEKKTPTLEHQSLLHRAQAAVAGLVDDIKKDAVGAASLAEWIGSGSLPVPQAQADERAAVCLSCPLNQTKRGRLKEAVASAIQSYTQVKAKLGLRAKGESDLKTCAACECPLRLKVWVPLKYILSHTDPGIFPDNCWVKKENKAPKTNASVMVQPKPLITIQRASAFGDVITATALASRVKAHGYNVRFVTHKDIIPVLAGHPDIAETVEVGTAQPDINLDGAYENHPDRKSRSILTLFEEAARKQVKDPDKVLGENGHFFPSLVVTEEQKKPMLELFSKFKKPWVVIVPRSGQWKNRTVPDDTWIKTAELVEGTCFWTGYERIGAPIVDLGTRNFRRVMAAVACADLVVTVDTGPMHVASALKKPILAIQQAFDLSLRLPKDGDWTSFSPDLECLKCCEFHCPINKEDPPCTHLDHERLSKAINLRAAGAIDEPKRPVIVSKGVPVPPETPIPRLAKVVHYVSVVLTVFKRHQHVDAAVKSIRNAGFTGELVITAGGITPELDSVLKRYESEHVIVVRNAADSTNTDQWIAGCKAATRRLVILFHDDDLMLPGFADALFPLLTGEAEYSISNAEGHGSPTAGPSDIAILKSGVSNSTMLEDTMMRLERTLSPIQGCFPRDLIISALEQWKVNHSADKRFEAWPGFEVGNDLYLWLKASSSLKKCLVLSKRYVSCNHHTGSATAANIASGTRQFETMYDLVRKIHKPRGVPRYRAICYVHDWSIASGFLRNLSENGGTGIVDFLTDCNTAPGGLISFKIPKIGPFLNPVNVKDISAFVAFIRGIEHARDHRLDWFFWVETDCRFNGANWLTKLWQENLAWPHDHVCSGTPVVWNLPMNGVAQAKTWMPYFADYTAKTGRLAAMEGWRHGPQSAYPNGALAWYRTDVMLEWFREPLAMKKVEMQEWCSNNTAFDWFVGRQMVTHYGLNAPKMMGFLSSSYSGCGEHFYTADDRRRMLRDGLCAIHQEKDNSL